MALTVQSTIRRPTSNLYFDPAFRRTLEQHLPLLRLHPDATIETIPADEVYRFEGDFYGLLLVKQVDPSYHWITLRLNHWTHPSQFGQLIHDPYQERYDVDIQMPPTRVIEQIKKHYKTKRA